MSKIHYRIVASAQPPANPDKKPRSVKYPMDSIPVGGAAVFSMDGKTPKAAYLAVYQAAGRYRKANPDFQFKVEVREDDQEIWVYRLPAGSETVSHTDYDYSQATE